mmetsp:Transcript_40081/g.95054  ORF Transcript_40081/g.95054 Transcript_40081/m.95054 type:complete len:438 (-) Transcript_40081:365-1678(-)
MRSSSPVASRTFSSWSTFALSASFSSARYSPWARETLRSICWSWKSALYRCSCCFCESASSWRTLSRRFRSADCAPEISAMRLASSFRRLKSSCDCLNMSCLSAASSFSVTFSAFSCSLLSSVICWALFSRSLLARNSFSRRRFVSACWRLAASSATFFASSESFAFFTWTRFMARSPATFESVLRTTSSSSWRSCLPCTSCWSTMRYFWTRRSASVVCRSVAWFSISCSFRKSSFSCSCRRSSESSSFLSTRASPSPWMASSRRFMVSMDCSHCATSVCRSKCTALKSAAVLSSSICDACVSVTSFSSRLSLDDTSLVSFSRARFISLIFISSARWYFCSARLSSSFCFAASAHCSISSWFQFICSLNASMFSLPRKMWFCVKLRRSCSSNICCSALPMSCRTRPTSRDASCLMCSSVSTSLFLASQSCCVLTSSC